MYIAPWTATSLDIVAPADLWLFATDIYLVGNVYYAGGVHEVTNTEFDVELIDPTTGANALHGVIDTDVACTSGNLVGVRGKVEISGGANIVSATGVWADWQLNNDISAATSTQLLYLSNNANSDTGNPTNVMYVYAPRVTNFINFGNVYTTSGGMCAASTTAGTMTNTVKCLVNGAAAYIHLYDQ